MYALLGELLMQRWHVWRVILEMTVALTCQLMANTTRPVIWLFFIRVKISFMFSIG